MAISKAFSEPVVRVPPRAHFAHHRGVTLVELMIAMLILAIVCVAWLEIIGIQSAKREARRREAVDRLAGMMDAFLYLSKNSRIVVGAKEIQVTKDAYYEISDEWIDGVLSFTTGNSGKIASFNADLSPVGYQLCVLNTSQLNNKDYFGTVWGSKLWLVGRLYDHDGSPGSHDKPFFELPVFLGY